MQTFREDVQKLLAAQRAGLKTVFIPQRNEPDLDDVPGVLRILHQRARAIDAPDDADELVLVEVVALQRRARCVVVVLRAAGQERAEGIAHHPALGEGLVGDGLAADGAEGHRSASCCGRGAGSVKRRGWR